MNKSIVIFIAMGIIGCGPVAAQSAGSNALSQTHSDAGAIAQTGNLTFEASQPLSSQRVHTTPSVYVAPSMFGNSSNNCGMSNTASVGVTGFGAGFSSASESDSCNTRQDVATAWNLGLQDVAILRFACFGEEANRLAYEASGRRCPDAAAKQIATTTSTTDKWGYAARIEN